MNTKNNFNKIIAHFPLWIFMPHKSEKTIQAIRSIIQNTIRSIEPFDQMESEHIAQATFWIDSGVEIFRLAKPATPDMHLVSYFLLHDPCNGKVLLTDHKNAGIWLPPGGHVEYGELPDQTVMREAKEELNIEANFLFEKPLFLTITKTVGKGLVHTDVSLWYILIGNSFAHYWYDEREFKEIKWFAPEEIPYEQADPHLRRLINKLYCRRPQGLIFDQARQSPIETLRSERRSPSRGGKVDEMDQLGKVAKL